MMSPRQFNNRFTRLAIPGLAAAVLIGSLAYTKHSGKKSLPTVQATVTISRLEQLLPAVKNKERYLDVFMVKRSKDAWRQDFSFYIFIRGEKGKEICIDKDYSESQFRSQTTNYVQWLYHQKVMRKDVPKSYVIDIGGRKWGAESLIRISIPPLPGTGTHPMAHFLDSKSPGQRPFDSGPVCPCPPGPCTKCPLEREFTPTAVISNALHQQYEIHLEQTRTP